VTNSTPFQSLLPRKTPKGTRAHIYSASKLPEPRLAGKRLLTKTLAAPEPVESVASRRSPEFFYTFYRIDLIGTLWRTCMWKPLRTTEARDDQENEAGLQGGL
jgi:hypothetical protein